MGRMTKDVLFLKHEFTDVERLEMGQRLAESYNRLAEIQDEEKVMKSQIKDRISGVELTIGSLSRNLAAGFTQENVDCSLTYDDPQVGEVTYYDPDGKAVKTRAMTASERQMDLPIAAPANEDKAIEESVENIGNYFGTACATGEAYVEELRSTVVDEKGEEYDVFSDPDPEAAKEATSAIHDAEFADIEAKPAKPRKPRGFTKPTNDTAIAEEF